MSFSVVPEQEFAADAAEAHLAERYGQVALAGPVRLRESLIGDERFTMHRLHLSHGVLATVEPKDLVVGIASHDFRWSTRSAEGALGSAPAVFEAGKTFTTTGATNGHLLNVSFSAEPLRALHRAVYGRELPPTFAGPTSAGAGAAQSWRRLVVAIATLPLSADVLRGHAYRALGFQLFESFQLTGPAERRQTLIRQRSRRYREAAEYVAARAGSDVGIADVALAVGVTVTELRRLFSAYSPTGESPEQHLRAARLDGAKQELLRADPSTTLIAAVAHRWGFRYSGTFVQSFLRAFGVLPSDLLGRERR